MWIVLYAMLLAPLGSNANADAAAAPAPWEQSHAAGALVVYTRAVADSALRELKAESVFTLAPEHVWSVILDTAHYAEFMPYMEESRRITSDNAQVHYEYQRINPPLIKRRDYVIRTCSQPDEDNGVWRHSWTLVQDIGPKPTDKAVRLTHNDGSWTLRRLDAEHTHVTYQLLTDPGGSLPGWVTRRANVQSIPELFKAVCIRAQKLRDKA